MSLIFYFTTAAALPTSRPVSHHHTSSLQSFLTLRSNHSIPFTSSRPHSCKLEDLPSPSSLHLYLFSPLIWTHFCPCATNLCSSSLQCRRPHLQTVFHLLPPLQRLLLFHLQMSPAVKTPAFPHRFSCPSSFRNQQVLRAGACSDQTIAAQFLSGHLFTCFLKSLKIPSVVSFDLWYTLLRSHLSYSSMAWRQLLFADCNLSPLSPFINPSSYCNGVINQLYTSSAAADLYCTLSFITSATVKTIFLQSYTLSDLLFQRRPK